MGGWPLGGRRWGVEHKISALGPVATSRDLPTCPSSGMVTPGRVTGHLSLGAVGFDHHTKLDLIFGGVPVVAQRTGTEGGWAPSGRL